MGPGSNPWAHLRHKGGLTQSHHLLTPREVAVLFHVDAKTVTRWADAGKLHPVRTLGGHRRYRADEVNSLLAAASAETSRPVGDIG